MISKLDPRSARKHLQAFRLADLFIEDLGWNHPERAKPLTIEHGGLNDLAQEISQLSGFRDRRGQTLFIDARKMGTLIDRVHRELTDDDIARIVDTYHAWLGLPSPTGRRAGDEGDPAKVMKYQDVAGFCRSATTEEIASHSWVLTPGRYVGAEEVEDDGDPFEEKMPRLVAELNQQFLESAKLEAAIRQNLKGLGYAL